MHSSNGFRPALFAGCLAASGLAALLLAAPAQAYEEVYSFYQAESTDGYGNITVEASIIHIVECWDLGENGGEFYVYEYVNRLGFRAIQAPDWGHAIGGKDFDTYEEAALAACGGSDDCPYGYY